ncbi:MAG TPA: hypothetical protein VGD29_01360 [Actinoplanes sp.]
MNPDDALMDELRRIASAVDGPPASVAELARAAFLTRDIDGELAVLIADSRFAEDFEPVRAYGEPGQGSWLLSFQGGGVRVDMEVAESADRLALIGQFTGLNGADHLLETVSGWRPLAVDDLGRFVVEGLRHGRIRLRCQSADGTPITTTWISI